MVHVSALASEGLGETSISSHPRWGAKTTLTPLSSHRLPLPERHAGTTVVEITCPQTTHPASNISGKTSGLGGGVMSPGGESGYSSSSMSGSKFSLFTTSSLGRLLMGPAETEAGKGGREEKARPQHPPTPSALYPTGHTGGPKLVPTNILSRIVAVSSRSPYRAGTRGSVPTSDGLFKRQRAAARWSLEVPRGRQVLCPC